MSGGECQTKNSKNYDNEEDEKPIVALDEGGSAYLYYCLPPSYFNTCLSLFHLSQAILLS